MARDDKFALALSLRRPRPYQTTIANWRMFCVLLSTA